MAPVAWAMSACIFHWHAEKLQISSSCLLKKFILILKQKDHIHSYVLLKEVQILMYNASFPALCTGGSMTDNQMTSESILGCLQFIMQILVKYSTVSIFLKFQCKVGYLVFSIY